MKVSRYLLAVAVAAVVGYLAGVLGTEIQHRNESTFGASYRQFQHEWLCIPALPGFLLAEISTGYDWGVDEAWRFRSEICLWNAAFWSVAACVIAIPFAGRDFVRGLRSQRGAGRQASYDY